MAYYQLTNATSIFPEMYEQVSVIASPRSPPIWQYDHCSLSEIYRYHRTFKEDYLCTVQHAVKM